MTYIVINENEIVKAEMERLLERFPEGHINIEWDNHLASLPRIPIQGKHNWKVWQEVEEGKDFYLNPLFKVGDFVKCLFNDSGHKFWFTREQKLTVSRVKKNKSVPFELSFKEKGEELFYANDFEHTTHKPIVAIPIQPTSEGDDKFIPPDHGDVCWNIGAETFTRKEVAYLLWTQRAMIGNDLKASCGNDMTKEMFAILDKPRKPVF